MASLSSVFMPNSLSAATAFSPLSLHSCAGINERVLVLVRLIGGNDGINTIIPLNQYGDYANLRPTIRIPDTGNDAYINLDPTLPATDQVGLHPIMSPLKDLYDNGELSVIQGVMYDDQDRSHFKSTDLWMMGGDGTAANNNHGSGWVGRYLEDIYQGVVGNPALFNAPLALQFAEKKPALLFEGHHHRVSTNLTGQDVAGYYSIVSGIGGAPIANVPNSHHGDLLDYIMDVEKNADTYSQTISTAFANGMNSVTYPSFDLADQLKTVARLVHGGIQTKVFLVSIGGFDTHSNQIDPTSGVMLGRHAVLLDQLAQSMKAFMDDIKALGIDDKILTATFSEFGRKVQENGSYGTDHGGAAPMFIMGSAVNGGVIGTNVNLSEATNTNNYQIETKQYDYRDVYATILQDWLGADTSIVDTTFFDNNNPTVSYTSSKIPALINSQYKVNPNCYYNSIGIGVDKVKKEDGIVFFPIPAQKFVNIDFNTAFTGHISMTDIKGRMVLQKTVNNSNRVHLHFGRIPPGIYLVLIKQGAQTLTKELVVR